MATSPPIKLTTLAALKPAIGVKASDTSLDTFLKECISAVSKAIINYLGRSVATATHTETYDIEPGQRRWFLKAYPIDSVTSVKIDHNREYPAGAAVDSSDYIVRSGPDYGYIELTYDEAPGSDVIQFVYVAGMGTTTAQLTSGFPEVEAACQIWIGAIVNRRKGGPGAETVSMSGGTITKQELQMPKQVKELLQPLKRLGWGSQ